MENNKSHINHDLKNTLNKLSQHLIEKERIKPIPFSTFLEKSIDSPYTIFRDIFQVFYDMVHYYVQENEQTNKNLFTESYFKNYDFHSLLQEGCDTPFFSDRLFANRFISLIKGFRDGSKTNQIILFDGPPGSGKSTFLNNLLHKLEEYTKTEKGSMYSTYWNINTEKLGGLRETKKILKKVSETEPSIEIISEKNIEFQCPSHDHPILLIPKEYRKTFLENLIKDVSVKEQIFSKKRFEWIFKDAPCSICKSLYNALLDKLESATAVYEMINAKKMRFNRQFGEGISLFNPGDPIFKKPINNKLIEGQINRLIKGEHIHFMYSILAKTNNGVFALMDIKEENVKRLIQLHGVISDGIHKVELIEERIKSIFFGLVNPGDKSHYSEIPSFKDRITEVKIPYILDFNIEVSIYKNKFGHGIENLFLPGVLANFAKIMVSTRLNDESETIKKWITNTKEYQNHLDDDFHLLKMELYSGNIPTWIKESDIKAFDSKVKRGLLSESETEGNSGLTGRQSINVFGDFFSQHKKEGQFITMNDIESFFLNNKTKLLKKHVTNKFISMVKKSYDYNLLQEIKECIYYYNREQISKDILNYIYALNFEKGDETYNPYTNEVIKIDDDFLNLFESLIIGTNEAETSNFRKEIQSTYITQTLAQEIRIDGKHITDTNLFKKTLEKYTRSLKKNALVPFLDNDNFRRSLIDFGKDSFEKYDIRLKESVTHLINNLINKYGYTEIGATQVCIYLIDNKIHENQ